MSTEILELIQSAASTGTTYGGEVELRPFLRPFVHKSIDDPELLKELLEIFDIPRLPGSPWKNQFTYVVESE